ncbi:hypothetical protein VHEMI08259 [[Torrubiella] hemipterigena]|uniref:Hydrophobin n=1 Tax=[Torrubiella] hemipterigena TaxID=1531966 RepID=A0A0A1T648_9HYPO|nr:hypothetical protein VHEMI08259 [[Torrubiella] hemipterigena]
MKLSTYIVLVASVSNFGQGAPSPNGYEACEIQVETQLPVCCKTPSLRKIKGCLEIHRYPTDPSDFRTACKALGQPYARCCTPPDHKNPSDDLLGDLLGPNQCVKPVGIDE